MHSYKYTSAVTNAC